MSKGRPLAAPLASALAMLLMPTHGDAAEPVVFELPLDFGTVCRFDSVNWRVTDESDAPARVTTSTLGVSAWGGFWGARWSDEEGVESGGPVHAPPGRKLRLRFSWPGATRDARVPLADLSVSCTPLCAVDGRSRIVRVELGQATAGAPPFDGIRLRTTVVTPHVKWATPLARGPVRVLFLVNFDMQREVLELAQRMELVYDAPSLVKYHNRWPSATYRRHGLRPEAVMAHARRLLDENDYEVVLIAGLSWSDLEQGVRDRVLESVASGTGLVLCLDPAQMKGLEEVAPLGAFEPAEPRQDDGIGMLLQGEAKGPWCAADDHMITRGIPFAVLPPTNYYRYREQRNVLIRSGDDPILAVTTHDHGRVAQFSYSNPDYWGGNSAVTPSVDRHVLTFPSWEYYHALLAKTVLWAAGRNAEVAIRAVAPTGATWDEAANEHVELRLENTRPATGFLPRDPLSLEVAFTFRDRFFEVVHADAASLVLQAGPSAARSVSVPVPSGLKAGLHLVDVIVRRGAKVENWATAWFHVRRDRRITDVRINPTPQRVGGTAEIRVDLAGAAADGERVKVAVHDVHDRLIALYEAPASDTPVIVEHPVEAGAGRYHRVRCELAGPAVLDAAERDLVVARAHRWEDYEVIVWGFVGTQITGYVRDTYYRAFRRLGTTALLDDVTSPLDLMDHARAGFHLAPIGGIGGLTFNPAQVRAAYERDGDRRVLVRTPCLSDPAQQAATDARVRRSARQFGHLDCVGYCTADEISLTSSGVPRRTSPAADICYSPHCLAAMRRWLKTRHASLADLNAAWDTAFETWEQVEPRTAAELRASGTTNFAPWAEQRAFMDHAWAETFRRWRDVLREVHDGADIGISGNGPPSSYTGYDYARLGGVLGYLNLYPWISQGELWSSLYPDRNYTHWAGYGQSDAEVRYGIWWSILHQHRGISLFKTPWLIRPDGTLNEHGAFIAANLRDVRRGIGRIVMQATKQHDGIALLHSQASMRAAWITGAGKPMAKASPHEYHEREETGPSISWDEIRYIDNLDGYCMLLKSASLHYRFVSDEQIDQGALDGFRVLILPFALALSDTTVARIEAFAAGGGLVIADVLPAVMDERCRTRPRSALGSLFGADFAGTTWSRRPGAISAERPPWAPGTGDDRYAEPRALGSAAMTATDGRAHGRFERGDVRHPAVIVNQVQRGRGVLLNFFLSNLNDTWTWRRDRDWLAALVGTADVRPPLRLEQDGQAPLQYETALFHLGPLRYLALQRSIQRTVFERDRTLQVRLPAPVHAYDVRHARTLGATDRLSAELEAGDAAFYALLPYQVNGLSITASPSPLSAGAPLRFVLQIDVEGAARAGDHVVHLEVRDPDGAPYAGHTRNVLASGGRYSGSVRLALDAPPGRWTLRARDVSSGITREAQFEVATTAGGKGSR